MDNCITRLTIEEDNIQRKKREMEEDIAERESMKKIEEFKVEKEINILGTKKKNINIPPHATRKSKRPRLMSCDTVYRTGASIMGDSFTPKLSVKMPSTRRKKTLASEYHQPLALEYCSEDDISMEAMLVATINNSEQPKKRLIHSGSIRKTLTEGSLQNVRTITSCTIRVAKTTIHIKILHN